MYIKCKVIFVYLLLEFCIINIFSTFIQILKIEKKILF